MNTPLRNCVSVVLRIFEIYECMYSIRRIKCIPHWLEDWLLKDCLLHYPCKFLNLTHSFSLFLFSLVYFLFVRQHYLAQCYYWQLDFKIVSKHGAWRPQKPRGLLGTGRKRGRGYGGGGRGRLYTYRYSVTIKMTSALRWAEMRAILMSVS